MNGVIMINEIEPKIYNPSYSNKSISLSAYMLYYDDNKTLFIRDKQSSAIRLPNFEDIQRDFYEAYERVSRLSNYLFAIDDEEFFVLDSDAFDFTYEDETYVYELMDSWIFRDYRPMHLAFAGVTGNHIYKWLRSRRFCGYCGSKTYISDRERAVICTECKRVEYPKISPAIIVAITDKDRLLMVKSATASYKHFALVAGFIEIGESPEDAVRREAFEEVGVRLKNIKPYKSQPWGFSETLMLGFTAELDGSDELNIQEDEISEARWFEREMIPLPPSNISVGQELIEQFKKGLL